MNPNQNSNQITIIIEKGTEMFGAWVEEVPGIYGSGINVNDVKQDILNAIELYKTHNKVVPDILTEEFEINWKFDTASFLDYLSKVFTKAGIERITGINQKQLGHYSAGLKKPRKNQIEKIDIGIRRFVDELQQIHLV